MPGEDCTALGPRGLKAALGGKEGVGGTGLRPASWDGRYISDWEATWSSHLTRVPKSPEMHSQEL